MTDIGPPNAHYPGYRPPAPRKSKAPLIIGIITIIALGVCAVGAVASVLSPDPKPTGAIGTSATGLGTPAPNDTKPATKPATSTAPAAPVGPKTTIEEGDWVVGTDVAPGSYRTTEAVSGMCYWGIYRAGTNKSDILQNDIVQGGRPSVTLKAGQEFSSTGCGTWAKTG